MDAYIAAVDPVIAGIGAALVTALGTYLAVARKLSGKIATSEASELWKESASIREWSKERIGELNALVAHLEKRVDSLEVSNHELVKENRALSAQHRECLEESAVLLEKVRSLTEQLEHARGRLIEREEKNDKRIADLEEKNDNAGD